MGNDIFVYLRVIEDTIDFFLTRPRMDAQLATLRTNMDRVYDLSGRLEKTRVRARAPCSVKPAGGGIMIRGLHYTRGSAEIRIPELTLHAGRVYAVTGPNGSGKSSLYGILASCKNTVLPEGLEIHAVESIVLPSDVLEITQHLYCPLFTKPISWMLRRRDLDSIPPLELQKLEYRIQTLSADLAFYSSEESTSVALEAKDEGSRVPGGLTSQELHAEADDWYGTLSGGQRGKAEFIREVFMKDACPGVLIIDEAFAPLDPTSKMLVQRKLKEFCAESVVLVIYHSDAAEDCVTAGGFFDENLHFSNGSVALKPTC